MLTKFILHFSFLIGVDILNYENCRKWRVGKLRKQMQLIWLKSVFLFFWVQY